MNILVLFSQPWRTGGAETHVEALLKGLSENNVFLAVNIGSDEEKLAKIKADYPYVKIIVIQTRGCNILRWKKDFDCLEKLIVDEKIQVISAQQRTAGIWAYLLKIKTGVNFTVTMHDPWHRAFFKSIYSKLFYRIFVVSDNLAIKLEKDFGFSPKQIVLIDNGIDFESFQNEDRRQIRKELNLSNGNKIILHVSRLSCVKGAVSLKIIESVKSLLKFNPNIRLIIIGEGPLRNEIELKINSLQDIKNQIEIRNFVDNVEKWYNASDLLIGEGRVALEALACLRPVVAIRNANTFIGVISSNNIEYACDVNFDGNDLEVTAENMMKEIGKAFLLNTNESEEIARYIKNRLSIEKMTKDYKKVFMEISV